VRHGAAGIFAVDLLELLLRFFVPEGVQKRDPAFKRFLHRSCAGHREVNRAKLLVGEAFMVMLAMFVIGESERGEGHAKQWNEQNAFHGEPRKKSMTSTCQGQPLPVRQNQTSRRIPFGFAQEGSVRQGPDNPKDWI